ncbi:MAG: hypothetical protein AAF729_08385 [Pseudomonadota bacterium]
MTIADELARRLAVLSNDEAELASGARVISEGGLPSPMQAILREIDETVLTRELFFDLGKTGSVTMVASGRRLLGLRAFKGDIGGDADTLIEQPLSSDDKDQLTTLASGLEVVATVTGQIGVTARDGDRIGSQTQVGLSVETLAGLFGVEYPFDEPSRLQRFGSMIADPSTATLIRKAKGQYSFVGDAEVKAWLEEKSETFSESFGEQGQGPILTILGQSSGENPILVVIVDEGETMYCRVGRGQLSKICAAWRKIVDT